MGLVGSNIFGREALAEIRVNAAQDLGDRRGKRTSLLGNPGFAQSVRGAKVGTTALQLGAGLSVPVGNEGNHLRERERGHPGWGQRAERKRRLPLRLLKEGT